MIAIVIALAAGVPHQDTAALDRAVAAFTGQAMGAQGGARAPVDPRLRLATCPMVALSWRTEAHDAVVAACAGPDWKIYVPVIMPPRTSVIAQGTAAAAAPVAPEKIIRRGDPVMIEAASDSFSITRDGIAMGDAVAGGRFMVKVSDTKTAVQAVAVESGRATLPGWGN